MIHHCLLQELINKMHQVKGKSPTRQKWKDRERKTSIIIIIKFILSQQPQLPDIEAIIRN